MHAHRSRIVTENVIQEERIGIRQRLPHTPRPTRTAQNLKVPNGFPQSALHIDRRIHDLLRSLQVLLQRQVPQHIQESMRLARDLPRLGGTVRRPLLLNLRPPLMKALANRLSPTEEVPKHIAMELHLTNGELPSKGPDLDSVVDASAAYLIRCHLVSLRRRRTR